MKRISVALSNLPGLLRDIVTDAVAQTPDIDIVGHAESLDELEAVLSARPPDLIIAAARDPQLDEGSRTLLAQRARPRLLLVTDSGRVARLYWLEPKVSRLGELTPEALLREIRAAAALETVWPVPDGEEP